MTATNTTLKVWRVDEPVRRLGVFVALLFVSVAAVLTAIGINVDGAVILWVMAIAVMVGIWRWYLVPYVALTAAHLEVQGVLSLRSVGYGSIRGVSPGPMGLQVQTAKDGLRPHLGHPEVEGGGVAAQGHPGGPGGGRDHGAGGAGRSGLSARASARTRRQGARPNDAPRGVRRGHRVRPARGRHRTRVAGN